MLTRRNKSRSHRITTAARSRRERLLRRQRPSRVGRARTALRGHVPQRSRASRTQRTKTNAKAGTHVARMLWRVNRA